MAEYKVYKYGMRLRGFAPMCQPMNGLVSADANGDSRYHSYLYYERRLNDDEVRNYELDFIGEENK